MVSEGPMPSFTHIDEETLKRMQKRPLASIIVLYFPLTVGTILRAWIIKTHGKAWFEQEFLPPVTMLALLATLVLIFAFQARTVSCGGSVCRIPWQRPVP